MEELKTLNGSTHKVFKILERFTHDKPTWGVSELSREVGINKSTIYRFLADLNQLGILDQDLDSNKYQLGLKLFELGNRVNIHSAFAQKTHPELEDVALSITETVHIGILKNQQVFFVDKVESPQGLRLSSQIGSFAPANATGLGKVLLAFSNIEPEDLKDKIQSRTDNSITDHEQLSGELELIRQNGYAIDKEEFEIGLVCVAVPIFNQDNKLIASLSASGPANRFRQDKVENYVSLLKAGASAIQKKIGYFKINP